MLLSTNQHDRLRTIIMGFEIPFRSYIAERIVSIFHTLGDFKQALFAKRSSVSESTPMQEKSKLGEMVSKPEKIYGLLLTALNCYKNQKVKEEVSVPNVADIVTLTIIFAEHFSDLYKSFQNEDIFHQQVKKYLYARNRLTHPGTKVLEETEMNVVLSFISEICIYLGNIDDRLFWDKPRQTIEQEIIALQSLRIDNRISLCNLSDMPFPDMRIVCRDAEINELKKFVYGIPGNLRKKSSYCIIGYGGLGKTALVLEFIKSVIKDVFDEVTTNNYIPYFILFFSAKEERLDISVTSGEVSELKIKKHFDSLSSLKEKIFSELHIESFENFNEHGIIVIDNLESLKTEARAEVREFIEFLSPSNVQYIITSRNEEEYETRKIIGGFESEAGRLFISTYIEENDLDIALSENEVSLLLEMSRGNTLVLVLCLRRLSEKLATVSGIVPDFSKMASVSKLTGEIQAVPPNAYELISEFMFKNTFVELESVFSSDTAIIYSILKIFAVYFEDSIDIYTICMLLQKNYSTIEPFISLLCKYLIIEKTGDSFVLNRFAEKYIIQRFLPDSENFQKMAIAITSSIREIKQDLERYHYDIDHSSDLKRIVDDWCIFTDGDRIAAAKTYELYNDVYRECNLGARFRIETALTNALSKISSIERTTMHPYIISQKARILQLVDSSNIFQEKHFSEIVRAYQDTIWIIKTNPLYSRIRFTKSFASILWLFGTALYEDENESEEALRYLEEARTAFEILAIADNDYYQCLTRLGFSLLYQYRKNPKENISYYRRSRSISNKLFAERDEYYGKTKHHAANLREELRKHGPL